MVRTLTSSLSLLAAAALVACAAPPADLDLALTRPTLDKKFVVTLQPPARPAAINQIHRQTSGSPLSILSLPATSGDAARHPIHAIGENVADLPAGRAEFPPG